MGGEVMDRVMGKIGEDIMGSHSRMIKNFFLVAPLLSENFLFFFSAQSLTNPLYPHPPHTQLFVRPRSPDSLTLETSQKTPRGDRVRKTKKGGKAWGKNENKKVRVNPLSFE